EERSRSSEFVELPACRSARGNWSTVVRQTPACIKRYSVSGHRLPAQESLKTRQRRVHMNLVDHGNQGSDRNLADNLVRKLQGVPVGNGATPVAGDDVGMRFV